MIDFVTGQGGNIIGSYPNVLAKNTSGAGATDGTALLANWVSNLWGMVQDLMQRAGLTPSGVAEQYAAETGALPLGTTSTQARTALQMAFGSPGELVLWCRNQAPATVGARILLLQGQTIAIANYKDLVAATYCGDALNNYADVPFYKSSDSGGATRNTAGTYFTLPDARGVTIRGIDIGETRDPQGNHRGGTNPNNYPCGSIQLYAMQGHWHEVVDDSSHYEGYSTTGRAAGDPGVAWAASDNSTRVKARTAQTDGVNGTPLTSSETRMINMAAYIGIRY